MNTQPWKILGKEVTFWWSQQIKVVQLLFGEKTFYIKEAETQCSDMSFYKWNGIDTTPQLQASI